MNVLHITPKTKGYEVVKLLANKVNKTNSLSVIEKDNIIYYTGGFILEDNLINRTMLDSIPKDNQYEFVKSIRNTPYIKEYYE